MVIVHSFPTISGNDLLDSNGRLQGELTSSSVVSMSENLRYTNINEESLGKLVSINSDGSLRTVNLNKQFVDGEFELFMSPVLDEATGEYKNPSKVYFISAKKLFSPSYSYSSLNSLFSKSSSLPVGIFYLEEVPSILTFKWLPQGLLVTGSELLTIANNISVFALNNSASAYYIYEDGMTFNQWISSSYNTGDVKIAADGATIYWEDKITGNYRKLINANPNTVISLDVTTSTEIYVPEV